MVPVLEVKDQIKLSFWCHKKIYTLYNYKSTFILDTKGTNFFMLHMCCILLSLEFDRDTTN